MEELAAFTSSYWGWGSESKYFVRAVDSREKKRGFFPPVFIDLRIARSVRSSNFKGNAFERIVGGRRYIWEPRLGNKRMSARGGENSNRGPRCCQ